jgi:hypothetical protein
MMGSGDVLRVINNFVEVCSATKACRIYIGNRQAVGALMGGALLTIPN